MNLIDALESLKAPIAENASSLKVFLACGFTPLHLETFLGAHLRNLCPAHRIEIASGLFGDLIGNVERLRPEEYDTLAVIVEWQDLDSRLGVRTLGGWQVEKLPNIVSSVSHSLERLMSALRKISLVLPTIICLPTLPLPPLFHHGIQQSSVFELKLRRDLAFFAETMSGNPKVQVLSSQRIDELSPAAQRFNLRSELAQGFPYKTSHASVIGEVLADLICRREPKKGLITDLDDTLWSGILGEVGVNGVRWYLEEGAQLHGLYQQFLTSLASAGILIAAASKNDAALVAQAFERNDILISKTSVFPIEAHWRPKSESVRHILREWNVLADSVLFVDDSPMEVAEVQAAFPEMECVVFPKKDPGTFWNLLTHLRNRFAKAAVSEEDSLRMTSIRATGALREQSDGNQHSLNDFLQEAEGHLTFHSGKLVNDVRAFELINKTNQFNLNGRRYDAVSWSKLLKDSETQLITVSYEDKFGKLGRIAALIGRPIGTKFVVESWVMSCRAFSRRIEFHMLQYLFERFDPDEIAFQVLATGRNGPFIEFLQQLVDGPLKTHPQIFKSSFLRKAHKTPHHVHVEETSTSE